MLASRHTLGLFTAGSPRASAQRLARADSQHAVRILQVFCTAVMFAPAYYVIRPIGGVGFLAGLVGMSAFVAWGISVLFGVHDGSRNRHPVRGVLFALWLVTLVSYVLIDRLLTSATSLLSADRYLMEMVLITGVALVAGECLRSLVEVKRVLRVLMVGASFCAFVACLQFWIALDLTKYVHYLLPGFTLDIGVNAEARGGFHRVPGTASDPIELGVVCGMLLPLAVYMALYDRDRPAWKRWAPVCLLLAALPTTVSRSAILAVASSMGLLVVMMPVRQRLATLACVPVVLAGVFFGAHGLIGTLVRFFGAGTADASVAHRTNNYPYVEHLVSQKPLFGFGGGTFIPSQPDASSVHILDNQYLHTAIELGLIGVVVLALFLIVPCLAAIAARKQTRDPELRLLLAALAGAGLAAAVTSAAFDSLSFPMFYCVYALVFGLVGTAVRLARSESQPPPVSEAGPPPREPERSSRLTAIHAPTAGVEGA
jgi:O-antigen ligase